MGRERNESHGGTGRGKEKRWSQMKCWSVWEQILPGEFRSPPFFGSSWVGRCFCDDGFLSLGRELGLAKELLCNQALAPGGEGEGGGGGGRGFLAAACGGGGDTLGVGEVTEGGGRRGGTTCCDDQGDAGEGERENDPKRRCVLLAALLPPFLHLLLPTSRPGWSHIRRTRDVHILPRYSGDG